MVVDIKRPPHSVRLHCWGRADTGWWGCVTWMQRVRIADGQDELAFAAWVPSAVLSVPRWASREELPRIHLADDTRLWPAPRGWPAWFAGVWLDGEPNCPPGMRLENGPRWRSGRR